MGGIETRTFIGVTNDSPRPFLRPAETLSFVTTSKTLMRIPAVCSASFAPRSTNNIAWGEQHESFCMYTISNYDDTLPLPAEVEQAFRNNAGDGLTASAWLADHGIDAVPERAAVIQYGLIWNAETSLYRFVIYGPDHIGPKHPYELAVPIYEDGEFIDLLFMQR